MLTLSKSPQHTIGFGLGLRKGEVLGLRWGAVDLEGRELIIDHQVQRELLYRETKTDASDATLPMPGIVATALVIRRDEQDKSRAGAGEAWQAAAAGPDPVSPAATERQWIHGR